MVLENISNQYDVLCLLGKGKGFQSYLCRGGDRKWIALWFDASLTQQLFPYFLSLKEEQTFEDLQDVFSWKEGLVVILACASMDRSLKDAWNEEERSWQEKLRLAEDVLTALCIREAPVGIAADLMAEGNIGGCIDGTPGCFYDLKEPGKCPDLGMEDFILLWQKGMEKLFAQQLQEGQARELVEFCDSQRRHPPGSFLELYQRFLPVRKSLEDELGRKGREADSRSVRFWKKIKKTVSVLKKVLMVLVLLGAIWFLISAVFPDDSLSVPAFHSIGTVILQS